jgi:hypothetical protein
MTTPYKTTEEIQKGYKIPSLEENEDILLNEPVFLSKTIGSLFLDVLAPTTAPTGSPRTLSQQMQYVLNELSPVNAGSFVTGTIYKITTVGTTDFTLIGAKKSEVGLYFAATGAGTGTGTATKYEVRMYFYVPQFDVWRYITLSE